MLNKILTKINWRAILIWLGGVITTLLGLMLITFIISKASPVDPVLKMVGDKASIETYRAAYETLGLHLPLYQQFLNFLGQVMLGNLGDSTSTGRTVLTDLATYFPATLELATLSIFWGVVLGVPAGMLAAIKKNSLIDQCLRCIALLGYSIPIFWLGLVGLFVFYAKLGWVPGPGRIDDIYLYTLEPWSNFMLIDTLYHHEYAGFKNAIAHLILPVALLAFFSMAYIMRMTRSLVLEELNKEYVLCALIKGASRTRVLIKHILPNIAASLITVIGLSYALLLEGAVLTESIFSWQGIGLYVTKALFDGDLAAVLGGTLLIGVVFILLNAIVDLLCKYLDPRQRS
ncbi:ABC transporter permease [Gammaproteobacteria bacterium]|nr:ABC transporter permease [Gammaproteobacteria bacterium]